MRTVTLWLGNLGPWHVKVDHDGHQLFTSYKSPGRSGNWTPCPNDMGNGAIEAYLQERAGAAFAENARRKGLKSDNEHHAAASTDAMGQLIDWFRGVTRTGGVSDGQALDAGVEIAEQLVRSLHSVLGLPLKPLEDVKDAADSKEFLEQFMSAVGTATPESATMTDSD